VYLASYIIVHYLE